MSISPETVIAKLARFRDGLARALDVACAVPTATTSQNGPGTVPAAAGPVSDAISPVPIGSGLTPPVQA